jgi:outer membrane protein assembly factor BamB
LQERWRGPAGESISTPAIVCHRGSGQPPCIAVSTDSGKVLLLNLENGSLLWQEPLAEARRVIPHGLSSVLPAKNGHPGKLFVTCLDEENQNPPGAILRTKTIPLTDQ